MHRPLLASAPLLCALLLAAGGPALAGSGGEGRGRARIVVDPEDDAPVTAGPMSSEAREAGRLFEAGRWAEAAVALQRVARGATADDEGNRQLAQYHLGVALFYLELYQASLSTFTPVAGEPTHPGHDAALRWLARLDAVLPEPADIAYLVGAYRDDAVARLDNPVDHPSFVRLKYLQGWYRYRSNRFEGAIVAFAGVDRKSDLYLKAQFMTGICQVQRKKVVPAVQAFQRLVEAADEGAGGRDEERLRELAWMSLARTFYSTTIHLDDTGTPVVDPVRLSSAVRSWSRIGIESELWPEAELESSWAYFMAGDYPHALGNLHNFDSGYLPASLYPEVDTLRALVSFATCQYDDAVTLVTRMRRRYLPLKRELEGLLQRFAGEGGEERILTFSQELREGRAEVPASLRPIVETVLRDRKVGSDLEYLRLLAEEEGRLGRAPTLLRSSPAGGEILDALDLARSFTLHDVATRARSLYQRWLDELDRQLLDAEKIAIDALESRRLEREQPRARDRGAPGPFTYGRARPDEEHVLWPFDGEFWKDELGSYRQVVTSRCPR